MSRIVEPAALPRNERGTGGMVEGVNGGYKVGEWGYFPLKKPTKTWNARLCDLCHAPLEVCRKDMRRIK